MCGALHVPRVRYQFGGVYPRHGIRCSYSLTRELPTPGLIAWEAAAYAVMRRQRRAALAEIRGVGLAHADGMKAGASRHALASTCRSASCSIRRWPHRRKWGYHDEQQQHIELFIASFNGETRGRRVVEGLPGGAACRRDRPDRRRRDRAHRRRQGQVRGDRRSEREEVGEARSDRGWGRRVDLPAQHHRLGSGRAAAPAASGGRSATRGSRTRISRRSARAFRPDHRPSSSLRRTA